MSRDFTVNGDRGFTLIEVLVTVAILVAMLLMAAPAMSDAIQNAKASSVIRRLPQDMAWARNRAATSGQGVKFKLNAGCTWTTEIYAPKSSGTGMDWTEVEAHSMTGDVPFASCSIEESKTILFDSLGLISNGEAPSIEITGKSGQKWTMQVLLSGMVLLNVKTSS